jgi:Flp pilus assembly protein TadD
MGRRSLNVGFAILFGALAAAQDSAESILQRAIQLHQSGRVEQAIPEYRAYLKVRPDNVDARSNLGAALAQTGRYGSAVVEYRAALKGRPGDVRIRRSLALAFYKAGSISEAAAELSEIHMKEPADQQIALLLADCWLLQGENRRVIDLATPLAKAEPDNLAIA